jgi:hypothetical protein
MKTNQWQDMISDLRTEGGLKLREIAEPAACTPSTISDLASGRTHGPSLRVGMAIVELHKRTMRRVRRTG